jgi:hypothetical protein
MMGEYTYYCLFERSDLILHLIQKREKMSFSYTYICSPCFLQNKKTNIVSFLEITFFFKNKLHKYHSLLGATSLNYLTI